MKISRAGSASFEFTVERRNRVEISPMRYGVRSLYVEAFSRVLSSFSLWIRSSSPTRNSSYISSKRS